MPWIERGSTQLPAPEPGTGYSLRHNSSKGSQYQFHEPREGMPSHQNCGKDLSKPSNRRIMSRSKIAHP